MAGITELVDLVRLTRADIGLTQPARVQRLLANGEPRELLIELDPQLPMDDAIEDEVRGWLDGFRVTTILERGYPDLLAQVHEAPAMIFTLGHLISDDRGVSIIGSRDASSHALHNARGVAAGLAEAKVTVVSGLAKGIDGAAHEAALDAGGRTVAIVGTAIDKVYPKAHVPLQQRIIDQGGLVLSQFHPGANPGRKGFPMRNAVMSGYGLASIVLAAQEKSGTRHQCQAAVGHGRRVIFAKTVLDTASWARAYVDVGAADVAESIDHAVELATDLVARYEADAWMF